MATRRNPSGPPLLPSTPAPRRKGRRRGTAPGVDFDPEEALRGGSGEELPVQFLKGVGPARARLLERMGVRTPADLLLLAPRRHEDRRTVTSVGDLRDGENATVRGRVVGVLSRRMRGRLSLAQISVADDSGVLVAEFWNQPWRAEQFKEGDTVVLHGRVTDRKGPRMAGPEAEVLREGEGGGDDDGAPSLHWGRLVPVYPLTKGLRQGALRRAVRAALDGHRDAVIDALPAAVVEAEGLMPLREALEGFHFPVDEKELEECRRRMRFEELFLLQVAMALRRRDLAREERGFTYALGATLDARIRKRFPWPLTDSQNRAIVDLAADFAAPHPMNRLLQGDVGSGKTAVALYAMLAVVAHHRQAALLAPTEILAEQHFHGFRRLLERSRVRLELLGGGMAAKRRTGLLVDLVEGRVDILIGTHALLEQDVRFRDLGLAVVDEQHRFGVLQRKDFRDKGLRPDLLYLTATPIPRTLCMTLFGDLDVSVIPEKPPGRTPVVTRRVAPKDEAKAIDLVRREVLAGRRAFFVCPLVEESEELDLRAAVAEERRLREEVFPDLRVGLLHGKQTREEKRAAMEAFRDGRTQVLVTTVVVEVGVDVPEATVLAILHAERFGLSQLHQLRGRVGRGLWPGTCLLFGNPRSDDARARLDVMVATDDGFRIAEEDLRIRGPGEFFGTRQHGLPELRLPEALADVRVMDAARRSAFALVAADPGLRAPAHAGLLAALRTRFGERLALGGV